MNFTKDMMVLVKPNLDETFKSYGFNSNMNDMKGKIFKIDSVRMDGKGIKIRCPFNDHCYIFKNCDVMIPQNKNNILQKSVLFDPNMLDI